MISFFNPRNIWLIVMTAAIVIAMYLKPPISAPDGERLKTQHLRSGLRALAYEAALSSMMPAPSAAQLKENVREYLKMYEKLGGDKEILPAEQFVILTYLKDKVEIPQSGSPALAAELKRLYVDGQPLPEEAALFAIGSRDLVRLRQMELAKSPELDVFKSDLLRRAVIVTVFQTGIGLAAFACLVGGIVIAYLFFKKAPPARFFVSLQTVTEDERRVFLEAAVLYAFLIFPVGMAFGKFSQGFLEPLQFSALLMLTAFAASLAYFRLNTRPDLLREITVPAEAVWWKEILAGIAGFAAIFPIAVVTLISFIALGSRDPAHSAHPVAFEIENSPFLIFILAAVMAPVMEEVVFRSFLYGHFRSTQRVRFAAFFSGSIFAALHPQGMIALPYLTVLGMGLAVLREYRPGVIAPMVAHAIVNGSAVVIAFFFRQYL